jgi:hypothetical protein
MTFDLTNNSANFTIVSHVDAAEGFAEDASGTGALQAGKEAATAIRRPP